VQSALNDLEKDLRTGVFQLRPLPEQAFERARQHDLQARHPHRRSLAGDTFDQQQRKLAQTIRLKLNSEVRNGRGIEEYSQIFAFLVLDPIKQAQPGVICSVLLYGNP
jgi:hypothetical protein